MSSATVYIDAEGLAHVVHESGGGLMHLLEDGMRVVSSLPYDEWFAMFLATL